MQYRLYAGFIAFLISGQVCRSACQNNGDNQESWQWRPAQLLLIWQWLTVTPLEEYSSKAMLSERFAAQHASAATVCNALISSLYIKPGIHLLVYVAAGGPLRDRVSSIVLCTC